MNWLYMMSHHLQFELRRYNLLQNTHHFHRKNDNHQKEVLASHVSCFSTNNNPHPTFT